MRHIVPSSRIVFTDFMILLVSALIGINSVMSFSEGGMERVLPPVSLPQIGGVNESGHGQVKRAYITVLPGEKGKRYFFNDTRMSLADLIASIRETRAPTVVVRCGRDTLFRWDEFCSLSSRLMKAGVKEISYAVTERGRNGS